MSRRYYLPNPVNGVTDRTYRIVDGGTSARTLDTAVSGLKVLSVSKKGIPNNPIPLDSDNYVPATFIPNNTLSTLNVTGPQVVMTNTSEEFVITDYDFKSTYTLAVIGDGTVTRSADVITFNAPAQKSTNGDGFTLNDVNYNITVGPGTVKAPKILTPVDLANNIPSTYTLTSSVFATLGEPQAHTSSTWQISEDAEFTTVVKFTNNDTVNKTSWTVTNLEPNMLYFARVKHTGSVSGDSYWSTVIRFQTHEQIPTALSQIVPAAIPAYLGFFGWSVSTNNDGTVVAIGSPGNNGVSSAAYGRVFIYNKTEIGWVLKETLRDSITTNEFEMMFGRFVKLNGAGNALLVSVHSYNNEKGAVVLFTKTNNAWSVSKRFYRNTMNDNGHFGAAFAMNSTGTIVIIGSPGRTVNSTISAGSIYVYRKSGNTWDSGTVIEPPDIGSNYMFGNTIDCNLAADTFVTSSYTANSIDNNYTESGLVYVYKYENSEWVKKQTIEKSPPSSSCMFGYNVSMDTTGDIITVIDKEVTFTDRQVGSGNVSVYTLDQTSWLFDSEFTVPTNDYYVYNVVSGSVMSKSGIVIAVNFKYTNYAEGVDIAKVAIFKKVLDVWELKSILNRPTSIPSDTNDAFNALALTQTGDTCVVGADRDSYNYDSLIRSGLTYIYQ